jgi:rSAM/selenodomain-associated transferase 2
LEPERSEEVKAAVRISVIVPVLNEEPLIVAALSGLQSLRARGHEVVVVDGGSTDATVALSQPLADRVISAPRGRASQMNAGARAATGEALLFLHADTRLPEAADALVLDALEHHAWGRFDVTIDSAHPLLAVVAFMMNLRSRITGIATGDQALFVGRETFEKAGGYPPIALMEDVALSALLKRSGAPACLRAKAVTSGRRWEQRGVLRTVVLMWRLRLLYFLGVDPARLARTYAR